MLILGDRLRSKLAQQIEPVFWFKRFDVGRILRRKVIRDRLLSRRDHRPAARAADEKSPCFFHIPNIVNDEQGLLLMQPALQRLRAGRDVLVGRHVEADQSAPLIEFRLDVAFRSKLGPKNTVLEMVLDPRVPGHRASE